MTLAAVLPSNFFLGLVYLIAYSLGLSLALLVVAFVGQTIVEKMGIVSDPNGWFKRGLGVLFIIVGIAIIGGADKILQTKILDAGFFDVTKIEQRLLQFLPQKTAPVENEKVSEEVSTDMPVTSTVPELGTPTVPVGPLTASSTKNSIDSKSASQAVMKPQTFTMTAADIARIAEKAKKYKRAPEISSPDGFVNTDGKPVTLKQLSDQGNVVLLDVWTYSCINCQRTLPHVVEWYEKYKGQNKK
jgi:thiol:disulfide interchange protein